MNKPHSHVLSALRAGIKSMRPSRITPALALCGLLLLALVTPVMAQQTVNFNSCVPQLITEPFNYTGTNQVVVNASIAGGTNEVDLFLSGVPAGVTATLSKTAITNSSSINIALTFTGVAEGIYAISINATNAATNSLVIPLQVGDVWNGGGGTANIKLSNPANWNGGIAPGPNDDLIIGPVGAQTNVAMTNILVDVSTTIASLRFATTNSTNAFHTVQINPGVTLSITGSNGFSLMRDYVKLGTTENVTIAGASGAMVVSNETANFNTLIDNSQKSLLDMSQLGTFQADVSQFGLGDCFLYPNFTNLQANAYGGVPKLYLPTVRLAMTNILRAVYIDPYNYTNGTNRAYGLQLGNDYNQATSSSAQLLISLGISNLFLMDGFCISGFGATIGSVNFNTNFTSLSPTAYFRNTDGLSRMSIFCIADAAGPVPAGANTKANSFNGVDFASNHGYVNALVDQFIMSRDHPNSAGGGTSQSQMELGQGIFDVNTAILGDQEQGNQTNINYCQAILTVSNTATFRVNSDLELGYTTAGLTDKSDPGSTYGQIAIGPGGIVEANQIGVGGVTKASGLVGANDGHGGLNQITLKNGALLIVSNNIADATPNGELGLLSFGGTSTLELFVKATNSNPYVYVNSLTTTGTGNTLQIGSVDPTLVLPAQVKLISYLVGTPTFGVSLPSGYSGAIINNGAGNTIDVYITAGSPKSLVWRGYINNSWDTTTKNWLDLNTGLQTNFVNLDNVAFDDAASQFNVSLQGLLIPGTVNMTNSINNYTLSGPGTTSGSSTLTKYGTASLDVEATTTLSVNMTQGKLTGGGTINSATIAPGATLLYSGTINSGILCGGTGASSGTINGIVDIQNGGIFTNLNTINGPLTLETNSFMENAGSVNSMFPASTVASNAFLLNMGTMNDNYADVGASGTLTVNGTFEDTGSGNMTLFRVTISPGAIFIPGGGGLATTTLNSDGQTLGGRLTLSQGSTTYIEMNPTNSQPNTRVNSGAIDYGPSQSAQQENGCTLVLTNITTVPFTVGQVYKIFGNAANGGNPLATGTATNSYPILVPAQPGNGIIWDLKPLWPGGNIGIIVPPIVTLTNSIKTISTNIVVNLSWPASQAGWVVQQQSDPPTIGITTNWAVVIGSQTNLSLSITNPITNTNIFFYRLAFP